MIHIGFAAELFVLPMMWLLEFMIERVLRKRNGMSRKLPEKMQVAGLSKTVLNL